MRKQKPRPTPLRAARLLRKLFESELPTSLVERPRVSAYQFALMVREQSGCTFYRAARAVQKAIPEVFCPRGEAS